MCVNPTRGCASLQVGPPESKYPRNGCEQRWDFPSSSPGGPHPTAGSPLQDRFQTAPRRERGGGGGADTCPGRGCCPRPRGAHDGDARGAVPWTAPHSPSSFSSKTGALWEWLPPMLVRGRLRIPRRQHPAGRAGRHPGAGAAARPPPTPQPQPGPAGGASAGLAVTLRHESDPSAPGRDRCWLARTELARLSSRRGRGGRPLGEEGGKDGGREEAEVQLLMAFGKR